MTGDVTVVAAAAPASASAPSPTPKVTEDASHLQVADRTYTLQWLRLSESGAYMCSVLDEAGTLVETAIADKPEDAVLAVAERLAVVD
jgi:hypothetical protein